MKTYSFTALGCKVNQYEIRTIAAQLQDYGLQMVPFGEKADLCIINTCCVTAESEAKSRKMIARARRNSPDAVVVITGCYAQIAKECPSGVDLLVPNTEKEQCVDKIVAYLSEHGVNLKKEQSPHFHYVSHDRTRATVKVQDGCDSFCSYCIIPYARGPISSKPIADAEKEVRRLVDCGFKEVILTGIHLTRYGRDRDNKEDLTDLIEHISRIDGLERIRLGSMEPGYLTPPVVARLAAVDKLCPHFHLSLQSGCKATLARMNRKYTPEQYYQEIQALRQYFPNCAITTDVMTGFPGETEEEFVESMNFVEKCEFAKVHVFTYSVRPGTVAAQMEQIPQSVRHARCRQMIQASERGRKQFLLDAIGKEYTVLLEREHGDEIHGLTPNYISVSVPSDQGKSNELIRVKIVAVEEDGCVGVRI